jgi:hypothetical protein
MGGKATRDTKSGFWKTDHARSFDHLRDRLGNAEMKRGGELIAHQVLLRRTMPKKLKVNQER